MVVKGSVKTIKAPSWLPDAIRGLDPFRLEPMMEDALDSLGKRMDRKGKGKGELRNNRTMQRGRLQQQMRSSMRTPRQTGRALAEKNIGIAIGMAPNLVRSKIIKPLEAQWKS